MSRFSIFLVALTLLNANVVDDGKKLFVNNCSSCHGKMAEGLLSYPLNGSNDRLLHYSPVALKKQIMYGGNGMIAYKDILKEEEIDKIIKYLHSIWPDSFKKRYKKIYKDANFDTQ